MRCLFAFVLLTGAFSASSVEAQSLSGPWSINIPQIDLLPSSPTWQLQDAGATFEGTMNVTVQSVIRVDGTMTGRKVFGPIYISDASFNAIITVPGVTAPVPALPTYKSLLIVSGNTMFGWSLQSIQGAPVNVYAVRGTRN